MELQFHPLVQLVGFITKELITIFEIMKILCNHSPYITGVT
jgi:hypothetical protein